MSVRARCVRFLFLLSFMLGTHLAFANPQICSAGYEDATCLAPISHSVETPPSCSTAAGWATTTPAKWEGSTYTSPVCTYTAAPTCPSGYNETTAPTWNGSGWVGLACAPSTPPGYTPSPGGVYANILAYCGITFQAEHGNNHIVTTDWLCSDNFSTAGGRGSGSDMGATTTYWNVPGAVFVNVVVASLHAHFFNSARGARSGLSQTSWSNSQLRVERDQRSGLLALARA
jgi:hypothetical protein